MNIKTLLASRAEGWQELEQLCDRRERLILRRFSAADAVRLASLYRAACADLALAEAYQMPTATVQYLNRLVGRAHNQLYRSQKFHVSSWGRLLMVDVPRTLLGDHFLHAAFAIFWGVFLFCAAMAYARPDFAAQVVGPEAIEQIETMYAEPLASKNADERSAMVGFYIFNNAGIGLRCFAMGLVAGIGGLYITVVNAAYIGTLFGHMATTPQSDHFFTFVTAHGPFELTAIVLSAAAGMRLGFALIYTQGYTRGESIRRAGETALATAMTGVVLFLLAALIEAFLSPSPLPYPAKAGVAIISIAILLCYYFGLGYAAQGGPAADSPEETPGTNPQRAGSDAFETAAPLGATR